MGPTGTAIAQVAAAIIGLAVIAVIVSRNSDTANIVGRTFTGFSGSITAAVAPVTRR